MVNRILDIRTSCWILENQRIWLQIKIEENFQPKLLAHFLKIFAKLGRGVRSPGLWSVIGNYSYAKLSIYLERNIAVFVVQVYLPAALIVTISWVTFWVKRNAVPARASIGVTAVLTMMTLTAGGVLRDPRSVNPFIKEPLS